MNAGNPILSIVLRVKEIRFITIQPMSDWLDGDKSYFIGGKCCK